MSVISYIIPDATKIKVVSTYADLPPAASNNNTFYWVETSTGTSWLPGSLGGTYRQKGLYYSNGIEWTFTAVPYQATQVEVDAGTNNDKFVTPETLFNSVQWDSKLDVTIFQEQNQVTKEPTGYPNRVETTFSFVDATRTFTIQPVGVSFDFWTQGEKHTITTPKTIVLPNVTGKYFIYFDDTETLGTTVVFDDSILNDKVLTVVIYYNATTGKGEFVTDERHGLTMDWATHFHLHNAFGTRYYGGFGLAYTAGDGSLDTHAQIALGAGTIADEDIPTTIVDSATPSAFFEQTLSPIAQIPVVYKLGNSEWQKDTSNNFPIKDGGGNIYYNLNTAGTYSLQAVGNNNFVAVWIFATPEINTPIISILGQRADGSLNDAKNNNTYDTIDWGDLPSQEYKILYRLIYEHKTNYGNSIQARIVDVLDLRGSIDGTLASGNFTPVADHGNLIGLNDDDHPQYHNDTRGDLRYYTKTQSDLNYEPKNSNIQTHIASTSNPHNTTAAQVGADPVGSASSAQAFAIQRANHTGTQTASTISDFDTEVSNNVDVVANTAKLSALKTKSGIVAAGTFAGNPKKATITFATAFTDTNYSVSVIGIDSRAWIIESVLAGSFVISANANANLTGNVYWTAIKNGEN